MAVDLTAVVLTRNHAAFVDQCLSSLDRSLPPDVSFIVVDLGSTDGSVTICERRLSQMKRPTRIDEVSQAEQSAVGGLQMAVRSATTEWITVISGDDYVSETYGARVRAWLGEGDLQRVANFWLAVVEDDYDVDVATPRWTGIRRIDRLWMCFENPGKAPGAVLPRRALLESDFMHVDPRCLIEDYLVWWSLASVAKFMTLRSPEVFYRRHAGALSLQRDDARYCWSVGYCLGFAEARASSWLQRRLIRIGEKRWLRQPVSEHREMVEDGRQAGRRVRRWMSERE